MGLSTSQTVFPPKSNVDQGLHYFDLIVKLKKKKCKPCFCVHVLIMVPGGPVVPSAHKSYWM